MQSESETTTPVEASAEAAVVDTEVSATTEATESESSQATQEQKPKGVQKRIDELTANWRQAEREKEWMRQQIEKLQAQPPKPDQPQQQATPKHDGRPTIDQFDDVNEFVDAMTEWKLTQRDTQRSEAEKKQQAEKTQAEQQRRIDEQVTKARQKHADFDDVVMQNPDLAITSDMAMAMVEMGEAGGDVAYHLGKNPQEAARIAQLPPARQLMELGRLEAQLALSVKKVTSAPAPVGSQITGSAGSSGLSDGMSTKEWIAARNAQLHRQK